MKLSAYKELRCAGILLAACALFILSWVWALPAMAQEGVDDNQATPRTVRVGLPESGVIDGDSSESESTTFMKDYAQAVAQYANWNIEYVEGSWEECLQGVEDGSIDVLLEVSKSGERKRCSTFPNLPWEPKCAICSAKAAALSTTTIMLR